MRCLSNCINWIRISARLARFSDSNFAFMKDRSDPFTFLSLSFSRFYSLLRARGKGYSKIERWGDVEDCLNNMTTTEFRSDTDENKIGKTMCISRHGEQAIWFKFHEEDGWSDQVTKCKTSRCKLRIQLDRMNIYMRLHLCKKKLNGNTSSLQNSVVKKSPN